MKLFLRTEIQSVIIKPISDKARIVCRIHLMPRILQK